MSILFFHFELREKSKPAFILVISPIVEITSIKEITRNSALTTHNFSFLRKLAPAFAQL